MIETLRRKPYSISDERVLEAMRRVPRHEFVPDSWKHAAYDDRALPIGRDQTISQPYIVAFMTQQLLAGLESPENARILEIGTGCGYQAAILAELVGSVYTVEIIGELVEAAKLNLNRIGYTNINLPGARVHRDRELLYRWTELGVFSPRWFRWLRSLKIKFFTFDDSTIQRFDHLTYFADD